MVKAIDFVLPWVDSSDLLWQKDRDKYTEEHNGEDATNHTRFRDSNTLKYIN